MRIQWVNTWWSLNSDVLHSVDFCQHDCPQSNRQYFIYSEIDWLFFSPRRGDMLHQWKSGGPWDREMYALIYLIWSVSLNTYLYRWVRFPNNFRRPQRKTVDGIRKSYGVRKCYGSVLSPRRVWCSSDCANRGEMTKFFVCIFISSPRFWTVRFGMTERRRREGALLVQHHTKLQTFKQNSIQ